MDYDIALLRIDYPVIDPDSGMNILNSQKFDPEAEFSILIWPNLCLRQEKLRGFTYQIQKLI